MQIAQVLAGYSLGGADLLRRAMGKKKAEVMAKEKQAFLDGAKAKEVDSEERRRDLRARWRSSPATASTESHSAAYGLITYQTAYLKRHYPHEFMAALLTS